MSSQEVKTVWIKYETEIRFFIIGGINTLWGLSSYPVLYYLASPFKIHYLLILVFNYFLNMSLAYLTNKYLVFRTTGNYLQEYTKFALLQVICFGVNVVFLPILVEFFDVRPFVGQTFFALLVIVSGYFWHKYITFSSKLN